MQFRPARSNFESVDFVFADFLHRLAFMVGVTTSVACAGSTIPEQTLFPSDGASIEEPWPE